jgi:hypothetical protein
MNKPKAHNNLIPVREFAQTIYNRRGFPVSVQYIYKLIAANKREGKQLSFNYIDKGKEGIWIKK